MKLKQLKETVSELDWLIQQHQSVDTACQTSPVSPCCQLPCTRHVALEIASVTIKEVELQNNLKHLKIEELKEKVFPISVLFVNTYPVAENS